MEGLLPFVVCIVLPLVWSVLMFGLGRWSASHRIAIERREEGAGAGQSPYYQNFEEV